MKLWTALLGALLLSTPAFAQSGCSGQPASGFVCGNGGASQALPGFYSQSTLLDRGFGSGTGTLLNRGLSGWVATVAPSLGVNGGTGGSLVLNGSTSGSATISVPAAAGSVLFQLPNSNGSNNQVLSTDGSGHLTWETLTGTGTVTSVGLSMPGIFSVTGSPVTVSGTLTATLNTQSANSVWAGPSSGAASAPTFRALVGADLPAPTTGSLGGVQANNAVSHQWVNAINSSGVPQLSQPSFADISGTAAASQIPDPTSTTLGGIESYVAVAHQWINSISTAGVPSSTQPSFADISGNASLPQLPGIGNNTVLGNNSGGTATPLTLSASNVLDMIGATQGNVLYRDASGWSVLAPGSSGQVLTTNGASANPSWTTVTGTGTVTQINAGTGIAASPSPITTTGTVSLAPINNGTILANVSGSSAAPTGTTPSSVLDVVGSTEGSILYRGASNWSALAPGTSGQFLQTTGVGSTPSWASAVTSTGTSTDFDLALWNGSTGSALRDSSAGFGLAPGGIKVTNTTDATSLSSLTGALQISGGMTIQKSTVALTTGEPAFQVSNCGINALTQLSPFSTQENLMSYDCTDTLSIGPNNDNGRTTIQYNNPRQLFKYDEKVSFCQNTLDARLTKTDLGTPGTQSFAAPCRMNFAPNTGATGNGAYWSYNNMSFNMPARTNIYFIMNASDDRDMDIRWGFSTLAGVGPFGTTAPGCYFRYQAAATAVDIHGICTDGAGSTQDVDLGSTTNGIIQSRREYMIQVVKGSVGTGTKVAFYAGDSNNVLQPVGTIAGNLAGVPNNTSNLVPFFGAIENNTPLSWSLSMNEAYVITEQ